MSKTQNNLKSNTKCNLFVVALLSSIQMCVTPTLTFVRLWIHTNIDRSRFLSGSIYSLVVCVIVAHNLSFWIAYVYIHVYLCRDKRLLVIFRRNNKRKLKCRWTKFKFIDDNFTCSNKNRILILIFIESDQWIHWWLVSYIGCNSNFLLSKTFSCKIF